MGTRPYLVAVSCARGPLRAGVHSGIYAATNPQTLKEFFSDKYKDKTDLMVCVTLLNELQIYDRACRSYRVEELITV